MPFSRKSQPRRHLAKWIAARLSDQFFELFKYRTGFAIGQNEYCDLNIIYTIKKFCSPYFNDSFKKNQHKEFFLTKENFYCLNVFFNTNKF
ncbi:hypothetical protein BpHYR1_028220 [Brachionus plicatilis]|uniref:Uncharacterized protein n=1 Tax=Brachionus plicatilis TaxID=10195 RepID=A0A3M7P9K3_BRAPC|nr:hypothetical protein BpHYR1_028220 [Brachionus plicatilis]